MHCPNNSAGARKAALIPGKTLASSTTTARDINKTTER
jgi:hypothetical protein